MSIVQIDSKQLEKLEAAKLERDDYLKASQIIRQQSLDLARRATGNEFIQGWLAGQRAWAEALLQVMSERP